MSPETETGVALWGATGRMGSEVMRLLPAEPGLRLVQAVVSPSPRRRARRHRAESCTRRPDRWIRRPGSSWISRVRGPFETCSSEPEPPASRS
jgi:hypothetical protein